MEAFILGLDGGGTKTSAMLSNLSGDILGRGTGGPSNYQVVGRDTALASIQAAIGSAFEQAGFEFQPVRMICLGLAGVGRMEDHVWLVDWCRSNKVAERIEVLTDGELLLWAGTPEGWGIGCISGTGSITFGIDRQGHTERAGGWGYILGDEGSGYAIGLAALRAITQASDGRASQTALTKKILETWNLDEPSGLIQLIYRSGLGREQISALASLVVNEADKGDAVATAIIDRAANDLSIAISAVSKKLNFQGPVPCALGGGVITHCPTLTQAVIRKTLLSGVSIEPIQVVGEPAIGAVKFAVSHAG